MRFFMVKKGFIILFMFLDKIYKVKNIIENYQR